MKCSECRFYDARPEIRGPWPSGDGWCRLNPPTAAGWPSVNEDDWCGEYEPNDMTPKWQTIHIDLEEAKRIAELLSKRCQSTEER